MYATYHNLKTPKVDVYVWGSAPGRKKDTIYNINFSVNPYNLPHIYVHVHFQHVRDKVT